MDIEIDKNKEENIISSQNVINKVLSCIGISRERTSIYTNYSFDGGELLRLRVSDHGLFLQYWYDKNREARMSGENIPKLNIGQNLAITFSLTATECAERNIPYPQKIANKTAVKTEQGNNAKPQFTVRHICYFTDKLEEADINSIINELKKTISDGSIFEEPLHDSQKVAEWNDTSNCQPQKVQGDKHNSNKSNTNENMNKNRIRLTESQLQRVIKESVKRVLKESTEIPLETINEYAQQLLKMFPYSGNKFTPFLRLAAKKQDQELGEVVNILCDISNLVYRLRNCDYIWRGNNGGESYEETHNRWQHEQD